MANNAELKTTNTI